MAVAWGPKRQRSIKAEGLGEGEVLWEEAARDQWFSLFWPLEKASSEQKVSTLNESVIIILDIYKIGSHGGQAGFVLECGSDSLQAGQLAGPQLFNGKNNVVQWKITS